eukprot:TRINITY_DN10716_c0_g1_i1.p2 TRINITY_DN10716_c0_g1~~TRINITY_DN10716_c0_g1_i1.p2  ORF type:complete len:116 (+),score=4.35 TRINITY_DN10716_c0_g1_i1:3-350(+)
MVVKLWLLLLSCAFAVQIAQCNTSPTMSCDYWSSMPKMLDESTSRLCSRCFTQFVSRRTRTNGTADVNLRGGAGNPSTTELLRRWHSLLGCSWPCFGLFKLFKRTGNSSYLGIAT